MTSVYDALETRAPAEREAALKELDTYVAVLTKARSDRENRPKMDARLQAVADRTLGSSVESVDSEFRRANPTGWQQAQPLVGRGATQVLPEHIVSMAGMPLPQWMVARVSTSQALLAPLAGAQQRHQYHGVRAECPGTTRHHGRWKAHRRVAGR